jgi:predicted ATPase
MPLTQGRPAPLHAAPQRFVIAGGPGSGKSTLLHALAATGENCYEEASRTLIREQLAQAGRLLPWGDLLGFAEECGARMRAQLADSARFTDTVRRGRCFFDRGLPDLIGYLSHGGYGAPDAWRAASCDYAPVVFFAPPWREIYVNDAERPQTFAAAQALSVHIRRAYLDCGFRLVELLLSSVADRLGQVLDYLETHQQEAGHG